MADLTWRLRVVDGVSAPAKRASRSLAGIERDLRAVGQATRSIGGANRAVSAFADQLRGARTDRYGAFGIQHWTGVERAVGGAGSALAGVGGIAIGVAATAAGILATFGAIAGRIGGAFLEMVRFREGAVTTLGVLGDGRGRQDISRIGGAAFAQAQALGRLTPAETRDVIGMQRRVATAGFRGADAERAMAAAMDVQALQSQDSTASERFLTGLSQMMGRSALTMQDLRQTAEAAGLNTLAVQRRAAEMAGISRRQSETERQFARRVEQAMAHGRISGAQGRSAVLAELSAVTGRGLGGFAAAQGDTLGGALSNATSALDDLILGIAGLENIPGVQALTRFIRSFTDALGPASRSGQQLQAIVVDIANAIGTDLFAGLDGGAVVGRLVSVVRQAAPLVVGLVRGVKALVEGLGSGFMAAAGPALAIFSQMAGEGQSTAEVWRMIGQVIGYTLGTIVGGAAALLTIGRGLASIFTELPGTLRMFVEDWPAQFMTLGTRIVEGLVAGLRAAWGTLRGTLTELAQGLPGPVRAVLGIHSPSRVFEELGRQLPAGMAQGIEFGARDAQGAAAALVTAPGAVAAGRAGGPIAITVHVSTAEREPEALGEVIAARIEDVLVDLVGRAALAGGS